MKRQERCARGKAWGLARHIHKLKEKDKNHILFAYRQVDSAGGIHQKKTRGKRVDSGASLHMVSKKDLNSADLETMRICKSPTTVMTANGEVQTREGATVCVKELDLFVTVMLLEETPAVLSLGKLCEDHGKTYHWTSVQKPHLTKNGKRMHCNTADFVPFVVPGLSTSSSTSSSPASSTSSSQDTILSNFSIGLMKCGRAQWQEAEATRKDFNTVLIRQDKKFFYLRALQGHSGRNLIDPSLQDNVLIPNDFFEHIYHIGCAIN